jgi:hypothetical protein
MRIGLTTINVPFILDDPPHLDTNHVYLTRIP